jgi:hypothetical protein
MSVEEAEPNADFARVLAAKESLAPKVLKQHGVTGIGVGYKKVGGRRTGTLAIVVTVLQKKPAADLASSDLIPAENGGVPTDVVPLVPSLRTIRSRGSPVVGADTQRYDPLIGGIGMTVGYPTEEETGFGTLGVAVELNGVVYLLTAAHVLFENGTFCNKLWQINPADPNDLLSVAPGQIQWHGGNVSMAGGLNYGVDCAAIPLGPGRAATPINIVQIGDLAGSLRPNANILGSNVRTRSAAAGQVWTGTVDAVNYECSNPEFNDAAMSNQIVVNCTGTAATNGDSGAIMLLGSLVVGMVWCGLTDPDSNQRMALVSPIAAVMAALFPHTPSGLWCNDRPSNAACSPGS